MIRIMHKGSRVSHRTEIVTVATPRGPVQVVCQSLGGLRPGSGERAFWVARRQGQKD